MLLWFWLYFFYWVFFVCVFNFVSHPESHMWDGQWYKLNKQTKLIYIQDTIASHHRNHGAKVTTSETSLPQAAPVLAPVSFSLSLVLINNFTLLSAHGVSESFFPLDVLITTALGCLCLTVLHGICSLKKKKKKDMKGKIPQGAKKQCSKCELSLCF